jgi:hypothetical protein
VREKDGLYSGDVLDLGVHHQSRIMRLVLVYKGIIYEKLCLMERMQLRSQADLYITTS